MGLKADIKKAVIQAFEALGDLVSEGTLVQDAVTGFDFSTGETTKEDPVNIPIRVAITDSVRDETGEVFTAIILKEEFEVFSGDLVVVDSVNYRLGEPSDNGYTVECKLQRGS